MSKEWKLNSVMNLFQLNYSRNVGSTSEEIRKCSPKELEDWETYYYSNVRPKEFLEESGKKLYSKIKNEITKEIEEITEDDCIDYMQEVVINRSFRGYMAEIDTVYDDLQNCIDYDIRPAPDKWDRDYCVDFYIQINKKYIGLQIKPFRTNTGEIHHIPQIFLEQAIQAEAHENFSEKYGGKVFYIFSTKIDKKYQIVNNDVITEIQEEINRLENE